jgi:hypothetical protein
VTGGARWANECVVVQCKDILLSYGIQDVDVELRESDFVQFAGPALLKPTDIIDPTAIVREPFTTTLGMNICAENTPLVEGTVGFFMAVNGVDKLYGVTLRQRMKTLSAPGIVSPATTCKSSEKRLSGIISSSFRRRLTARTLLC